MDVSYRRDKDHNYMILDAPGELTGEEYQVRMLVGNHIPHLLKCNRRMMDGKAVFFYEVTGMQPMFRVFEKRQINQEEMVELLQDIKEALENTQRYLLDGNQLLFEPEFLFFHTQTREWNLCYLPTYDGNMTESFRKLSEYLLKRLDHSDEQAVMLGYEVYSKASEENYRISEVLQMIYQVGRKNCAQEEGLPEDPEQSEKVKISKKSEVSVQKHCHKVWNPVLHHHRQWYSVHRRGLQECSQPENQAPIYFCRTPTSQWTGEGRQQSYIGRVKTEATGRKRSLG